MTTQEALVHDDGFGYVVAVLASPDSTREDRARADRVCERIARIFDALDETDALYVLEDLLNDDRAIGQLVLLPHRGEEEEEGR